MRKFSLLVALTTMVFATTAVASTDRILDGKFITNGSATLTLPTASDTLTGRDTTDILTNKTMTGVANSFSLIPVGAIGNGSVLSGSNSGDVTLGTAHGLSLSGQALSLQAADASHDGALLQGDFATFNAKLSSALTTNHIFVGSSGVATDVAMSGDATIAASGALTIGAKKIQASKLDSGVAASGTVATADGSGGVSYAAPASTAPAITGSRASATSITAVGGISFSSSNYNNDAYIKGSGGPVTVTASPQIAAGSSDGQRLTLIGRDATNTVTLADGTGLSLNGPWVGGLDSVLELRWDGSAWVEMARR